MAFDAARAASAGSDGTPPRCQSNGTAKWYAGLLGNETARERGPTSAHSMLWLSTVNPTNNFESTCTLISAIHLMQQSRNLSERRWELRWHWSQQHYFPRLHGHAAMLAALFVKHVWRDGRPLRPVSALVAPTCFADAAEVTSFTFLLASFRGAAIERAARTFQRTVWRHFAVPPILQPSAAEPVAVLLQRRGARAIVNEDAVVALVGARGFALRDVIIPEEATLLSLLSSMRRASLAVTIHGAGMINQVFMPVGSGAVIEAFQPHSFYGTGLQLAAACAFFHQPLLLEPSHADLAPTASASAFKASPFARWRGWTNDSLAKTVARCVEERARRAAGGLVAHSRTMCGGVWKSLKYRLPPPRLALLLDSARHALRRGDGGALEGASRPCLPRVMVGAGLERALLVQALPPRARLRPLADVLDAELLGRIGLCGVPQEAARSEAQQHAAVWLRMHGAAGPRRPANGVLLEFVPDERLDGAAYHHPHHLRSFCQAPPPPPQGGTAKAACVVRVEELAALLQAALAYLSPSDPPNLVGHASTARALAQGRTCCRLGVSGDARRRRR